MKKDWEVKKLREVIIKSSSNVSQNQLIDQEGIYPIYGASGFIKNIGFYHQDKKYISIVKDGAGIGRIALQKSFSSVIGTLQYLTPTDDVDIRFIYYFLLGIDFFKYKNGSTIPHIYFKDYAEESILVPPLPEQQRIVVILDEAFEAISKAKKNAEKNLQNAREIFDSYLQSVFANREDGWDEKILGEICDFQNGFAFKSEDAVNVSKTQLIRMGNLYKNQLDLERRAVYYPEKYAIIYKKYLLKENDLIISLTGTTGKQDYGFTVKIPKTKMNMLLNQRIAKIIILDKSKTITEYFLYFLLSRAFLNMLYKTANGTRQANVSTEIIKKMIINIPKANEQQRIVSNLDALSTETKKLEAIYNQKLIDLEELKKSILQKAFSGQL